MKRKITVAKVGQVFRVTKTTLKWPNKGAFLTRSDIEMITEKGVGVKFLSAKEKL